MAANLIGCPTTTRIFSSKEQGSEIVTLRDLVIVDEEKKLLLMTLWNQFDDNEGNTLAGMIGSGPMIFDMRLKVTTFNCLSLTTTRGMSGFMINPPVSPDLQMQPLYNENKLELRELLEKEAYKNSDMLFAYPKEEDIVSLATAYKTRNASWVKGKISLVKQGRSLWSRLSIKIQDETTTLCVTICTPEAEKIMPFTALQLRVSEEMGIDLFEDIATSLQQHTVVAAFIRTYEASFIGQREPKVSVVKVYTSGQVLSSADLVSLPAHGQISESSTDVNIPAAITTRSKSRASASAVDAADKGKEQLFTPSTKLALEEISSNMASNHVKRSLPFSNDHLLTNSFGRQ
ncbi:hypothetical protein Tco_0223025 [Tanacetum coccineum]